MPEREPIRLMLLDDHPLILRALELEVGKASDLQWLGSFTHAAGLIAALREAPVDLVVMDYALQPGEVDGLSLIRTLRAQFPAVRLLLVSSSHVPATVAMSLRCGARGFVGKELVCAELTRAIRQVAGGRTYLHPQMVEALRLHEGPACETRALLAGGDASGLARRSLLTAREHEVLRCCLDGLSVTRIAEKFSRSVKTISTQKQAAFRKLGLRSDNELYKVRYQLEGR